MCQGDGFSVTGDGGDLPQDVAFIKRRIVLRQCVALSDEGETAALLLLRYAQEAVNPETPVAETENDVAGTEIGKSSGADREKVTWIDRWQHAAALRNEPHFPELAHDVGGEVQFDGVAREGRVRHEG